MKIDIYQSTKDRTKFLSVPEGTDVSKLVLSGEEAKVHQQVSSFKKGFTIEVDDKRAAINANDIIEQIKKTKDTPYME